MPPITFRQPPQLPVAFVHTPERLLHITKESIEASRKRLDEILEIRPRDATFENSLLPLVHEENELASKSRLPGLYKAVAISKDLRDASIEAVKLWSAYGLEITLREDRFQMIDAVYKREESLDAEATHYLAMLHAELLQNGLGLPPGPPRKHFESIKNQITALSQECVKNVRGESGGLWFTRKELDGLPKDALSRLHEGEVGSERESKFWVSFKAADLDLVATYACDPETRRRAFIGNENKCEINSTLFRELIELRTEAAQLLGYASHVDLKSQNRMMTSESIRHFLENLHEEIKPAGKSEKDRMRQLKRADLEARGHNLENLDDRIYLWDQNFYSRLVKEKGGDFDTAELSEYFPLETTLQGLLRIFETIFGLLFDPISNESKRSLMEEAGQQAEAITWHEDVKLFAVYDEEDAGGGFLGYLYLDLLKREGKADHPCNICFQPGFHKSDGSLRYPSTTLLTSFLRPTPTRPTLLQQRQVVTLFHELGHGIHSLVGRTRFASTWGTRTSRDFVEIPSKMLENWCWIPDILRSISAHYSSISPEYAEAWKADNPSLPLPPKLLPLELAKKLAATRNMNLASMTQRQLHLSSFDRHIHGASSKEEVQAMDFAKLYNELRKDISGLCGPEVEDPVCNWGIGHTRFQHMFSGYDGGYYAYALASVYSRDLFETKFRHDPLNASEGRRYREIVLGRGGSRPEMSLLEEYLGRPPNGIAFSEALKKAA